MKIFFYNFIEILIVEANLGRHNSLITFKTKHCVFINNKIQLKIGFHFPTYLEWTYFGPCLNTILEIS